MKVTKICKLFNDFVNGMGWALSLSRQGITEVPDKCPAAQDRMRVLNSWQDLQERASRRKNRSQARMVSYLLASNRKRLVELRDEIIKTLVAHGHADKVRALGFKVKEE